MNTKIKANNNKTNHCYFHILNTLVINPLPLHQKDNLSENI